MELSSICFCDWTGYLQSLAKFGTMSKLIKSKINIIYNNNNAKTEYGGKKSFLFS